MYKQVLDPVSGSLGWSSLLAVLPLLTLFLLLGGLSMKAVTASLISLAVAIIVAIAVYSMPFGQSMDAAAEGAAFGFFPIMWIVINALWIYNMTQESGHFAILRQSFSAVSADERVQAVIIAFAFGALLEALAGFGTPVAICSVMLIALGFKPMKAVVLALVADTAPVAFGAIAIPIVTLSQLTGISQHDLGSMVGRQTPFLAIIIPFILVAVVDGWRGIRQAWPAALVGGTVFAALQEAMQLAALNETLRDDYIADCQRGVARLRRGTSRPDAGVATQRADARPLRGSASGSRGRFGSLAGARAGDGAA